MSEIVEHIRELCADHDRIYGPPGEDPFERRRLELAEIEKRQQARAVREARVAREAEEKQRAASTSWYAAVDGRINEHLQNWLWNAIDERIREHFKSHDRMYNDAVGGVIGKIRAQLRREFKHAIEDCPDPDAGLGRDMNSARESGSNTMADEQIRAISFTLEGKRPFRVIVPEPTDVETILVEPITWGDGLR